MDKFLIPVSHQSPVKRNRDVISSDEIAVELPSDLLTSSLQDSSWRKLLAPQLTSPYFDEIRTFLAARRERKVTVYPPIEEVFTAFNLTPFDQVRVVLIGQDPYIRPGQAHGLCFSVKPPTPPPPSLVNIYKELLTDIPGFKSPKHGYLESWARQGILMLNATMTVDEGKSNSHATAIPWQRFTDAVIDLLNKSKSGLVFILWGGFAQKKCKSVDAKRHRIIKCAHPSPLSATSWWGNRSFSRCNAILRELGQSPINWHLPETVSLSPSPALSLSSASPRSSSVTSGPPQKAQRLMHSLDKSQSTFQNPLTASLPLASSPSSSLPSSSSPSSSLPSSSLPPSSLPSSSSPSSSSPSSSSPPSSLPPSSLPSSASLSTSPTPFSIPSASIPSTSTIEMDELMLDASCIAALLAPCSPIDLGSPSLIHQPVSDSIINAQTLEEESSFRSPTEDPSDVLNDPLPSSHDVLPSVGVPSNTSSQQSDSPPKLDLSSHLSKQPNTLIPTPTSIPSSNHPTSPRSDPSTTD